MLSTMIAGEPILFPTGVPLSSRLRAIEKSRKRKKWLKRLRARAGRRK